MSSYIIAFFASLSTYAYSTSQKLTSQYISPISSVLISNLVVFILSLTILFGLKSAKQELLFDPKGIVFGILVGIFATGIEILWILAYSKGISLINASVVAGVVGTIFTIVSATFIFHESISILKLLALLMAISSGVILSLAK